MKRKVIQLAGKTLVVSLPNRWVKHFGVKKGDEIDVEEDGSTIIINTDKSAFQLVELDLNDLPLSLVKRSVLAAYKNGFSELRIFFSESVEDLKNKIKVNSLSAIQEIVRDLVGVEVVDSGKSYCVIKEISRIEESEFDSVFRRISFLVKDLADLCYSSVNSGSVDIEEIELKCKNIGKLVDYCLRSLNSRGYKEYKKTALYHSFIVGVFEICDIYRFIMREFAESKRKVDSRVLNIFKKINDSLVSFYDLFYKYKKDNLIRIVSERRVLFSEINELNKEVKKDDLILLHRLSVIINKLLNLAEMRVSLELL